MFQDNSSYLVAPATEVYASTFNCLVRVMKTQLTTENMNSRFVDIVLALDVAKEILGKNNTQPHAWNKQWYISVPLRHISRQLRIA
jgi:hypothetical protein